MSTNTPLPLSGLRVLDLGHTILGPSCGMMLADLGAVLIDADKVGHEILRRDSPVWRELVAAFGADIVGPDGEIDRARLAGVTLGDEGGWWERMSGINPGTG